MVASAATRPRYGGELRVDKVLQVRQTPAPGNDQCVAKLVFEDLTKLDQNGTVQPELAQDWRHDAEYKKWQFELRPGVKLHSGASLTAVMVADSLRAAGVETIVKIAATGDSIFFESETPLPALPELLALPRFAIAVARDGSGPFQASGNADQQITLKANDDHWAGRAYLDSVAFSTVTSQRQAMADLQLGKTDAVEIQVGDARGAEEQGLKLVRSRPDKLIALVFDPARQAVQSESVRRAIALSIDRNSIWSVLLGREGGASAALLPQWMSGYSFLFPVGSDVDAALSLNVKASPLVLNYDFSDPVMKSIAERIAVNERDVGITIQVVGENMKGAAGRADLYLLEVPLASGDPRVALSELGHTISSYHPVPQLDEKKLIGAQSPEALYRIESAALSDFLIVPVAHIPEIYGLSQRVHGWSSAAGACGSLAGVWVESSGSAAGATR